MNVEKQRGVSVPLCRAFKSFNKVFGIGANKTGTTSLQSIYYMLGLEVAPQHDGELYGVQAQKGNLQPLAQYVSKYDAFQDAPFSVKGTYAQMDALFPNSKFILTFREPEQWFNSLHQFHKKILQITGSKAITKERMASVTYLYPGYLEDIHELNWLISVDEKLAWKKDWNLAYNREHYISVYMERNRQIIQYFSERPDDLLVIDITMEKDTAKIVDFLKLPPQLVTNMPHLNQTGA